MQTITISESSASLRRLPFLATRATNNSVQLVDLGDIATADTFVLDLNGQNTGAITFAADMSSAIVTALEGLSNVEVGDVVVTLLSAQIYMIQFGGSWAYLDVPLLLIESPTTFTPGTVTGGLADTVITDLDFAAADVVVSKNGAAFAESDGTVAEIGEGLYHYVADAAEVDTLGYFVVLVLKAGVALYGIQAQVVPAATSGETVRRTGTAQAGAPSAITLDTGASGTSNFYVPSRVTIESGLGAGQGPRYGWSYNGGTKVLSVEPPWTVEPDSTSVFKIVDTDPAVVDLLRANHATANTFGETSTPADVADEVLARMVDEAGDGLAAAFLDLSNGVETALTLKEALRLIVAVASGKVTGGGTTSVTFRNIADDKDRIVATVDTSGNRSAITMDLT